MKEVKSISLTPREIEILYKITEAHNNSEIAKALMVSESTVHKHIENIYRKFNVHNRVQLIIKAVRLHIINI